MKERLVKAPSFLFTKSGLGKGLKDRRSDFLKKLRWGEKNKGELVEKCKYTVRLEHYHEAKSACFLKM